MTEEKKTAPAATVEKKEQPATPGRSQVGSKPSFGGKKPGGRKGRGRGRDRGPREPKEFEEAILKIDRVTRVVKGGRRMRFRITVVIGDKKGRVGFGIGKSAEVLGGIQKAVADAKKNLINVSIVDGTIPHPANEIFKSSRVLLLPAAEGKGVIAGGAVRKILELAGVRNVLSKSHGSRNKINIANATFKALLSLSTEPNPGKKVPAKAEKETEENADKKEVSEKKTTEKKPVAKKPAAKKVAPKKETPKKAE